MEFVEPVLLALTAGAALGVGETASTAVHDAYRELKNAVGKLIRRRGSADETDSDAAIDERVTDPTAHQEELVAALAQADPDERAHLIAAARRLLESVGANGSLAGKYCVDLRNNKGVQVGDGNTQANTFGA